MTHPTRVNTGQLSVTDAMRRISDRDMTEMCLAVNRAFGSGKATLLLDLFGAARKAIRDEDASKPEGNA